MACPSGEVGQGQAGNLPLPSGLVPMVLPRVDLLLPLSGLRRSVGVLGAALLLVLGLRSVLSHGW